MGFLMRSPRDAAATKRARSRYSSTSTRVPPRPSPPPATTSGTSLLPDFARASARPRLARRRIGAHAAAPIALIPASHRLYVWLGSATEDDDSFPLTDGGTPTADREGGGPF